MRRDLPVDIIVEIKQLGEEFCKYHEGRQAIIIISLPVYIVHYSGELEYGMCDILRDIGISKQIVEIPFIF